MEQSNRVFCIGFQKTGTTSLGVALSKLGYNVCGYNDFRDLANSQSVTRETLLERACKLSQHYTAFKDTPWPLFYKEFDSLYPGSKFIHVVRNSENWIKSVCNDFGTHPNMIHRTIYGSDHPVGNESDWLQTYNDHNHRVKLYFQNRPHDYLLLSLDNNEVNYGKIAPFLEISPPDEPWPHANTRLNKYCRMTTNRLLSKLRLKKL
ncbi:MAG: sulfotransferase family protein [Phycisphaerales bacterium JB047]